MLVQGIDVPEGLEPPDPNTWPYSVPAVGQLLSEAPELRAPMTFLVGENGGSGKSTLVEAIAEAYGLDARGDVPDASTPTIAPRPSWANGCVWT